MKKQILHRITAIAVSTAMIFTLSGCSLKSTVYKYISGESGNASKEGNEDFDAYMKDLFIDVTTSNTVNLHFSIKDPAAYGIEDYEVTWGEDPFSEEAIAEDKADMQEVIDTLNSYDYNSLSEDQQLTYDIVMEYEETSLEFYDYLYYYEPFSYTSGVQTNLPITMAEYSFYTEQDVKDYLELLELMPEYINYYLDFEKVRSEKGFFMSDDCADDVIEQCEDFISNTDNHYLIQTFDNRLDGLGLDSATSDEYKEKNEDIVLNTILPEFEYIIEVFEDLKGTGTNENGLYYYDEGQEYYKYLLRSDVCTDKTPEEIIETLDDAIDETMTQLMVTAYSDIDAYYDFYDSNYSFTSTEPSTILSSLELCAAENFPVVEGMDYDVVYVDESLEDSLSPAFVFSPCIDDYLNNHIYINGGSTDDESIWNTLCHEGYPGHLYQFAYFYSTEPAPIRTALSFSGYTEGWAEYVEMQSYDWAVNENLNSTMADLLEINSRISLYVSARVEIGVNYEGWTVEDCADYLNDNGFNGDAASEIFTYVVAEPANYQMYCIGMLTLEELKSYTSDELGSDFSEMEYNELILSVGPCQFDILRTQVENYISEKKK